MAQVERIESANRDRGFEKQVQDYVEGGMSGCLECDAKDESIRVGHTDISDDGSAISIHHECSICGTEWVIEYTVSGIGTRKPVGGLN